MIVFIVLWPYLLTTKLRSVIRHNLGHSIEYIAVIDFLNHIFFAFQKETSSLPKLDLNLDDAAFALGPTEQQTLLVSTLDGSLKAIDMAKGEVIWELSDEPVVRSPYDSSNPVLPAFLPDPKDGSLYMIGSGMKEPLKKLPFTIPELVAASPCKSTDGILYTGKKVDTWFSVDRYTGNFPTKFRILEYHGNLQFIECYFFCHWRMGYKVAG